MGRAVSRLVRREPFKSCADLFYCGDIGSDILRFTDVSARDYSPQDVGQQLALRVAVAPIGPGPGASLSPFGLGDDVAVTRLKQFRGFDCLDWRQHYVAEASAGSDSKEASLWPALPRLTHRFQSWQATIVASDGEGGLKEVSCLLQIGKTAEARIEKVVEMVVRDSQIAASYAGRFNEHVVASSEDSQSPDVPSILVAAPVGCYILSSAILGVRPGETVLLWPWPEGCAVDKFLFDGTEEYVEMTQAFFHYTAFASGGREFAADLQGLRNDDQSLLLVDPVIIPAEGLKFADLLDLAIATAESEKATPRPSINEQRFNHWHPTCAQLCKTFDPQRRTALSRGKACGLTCGIGGL